MKTPVFGFVASALIVLLSHSQSVAAQDVPRIELSGGYALLHLGLGESDPETLGKGWYADIAANVAPLAALVFQASGHYKTFDVSVVNEGVSVTGSSDLKLHQYLAGIRLTTRPTHAAMPFAQVLVGVYRTTVDGTATASFGGQTVTTTVSEAHTDIAFQTGGGLTVVLQRNLGFRGEVAYVRLAGEGDGINALHASVGMVVTF